MRHFICDHETPAHLPCVKCARADECAKVEAEVVKAIVAWLRDDDKTKCSGRGDDFQEIAGAIERGEWKK